MSAPPGQERGSLKMLHDRLGSKAPNPEEHLKKVLALHEDNVAKLVNIWTHGQPNPEEFGGTFRVGTPVEAGQLIEKLTLAGLTVVVFPYGIPAVDEVLVQFETFQGAGE